MFVPDLTPTFYGAVSAGMGHPGGWGWEQRGREVPEVWFGGFALNRGEGGVGAATFVTAHRVCHLICHRLGSG